jgi:hypothetical protein
MSFVFGTEFDHPEQPDCYVSVGMEFKDDVVTYACHEEFPSGLSRTRAAEGKFVKCPDDDRRYNISFGSMTMVLAKSERVFSFPGIEMTRPELPLYLMPGPESEKYAHWVCPFFRIPLTGEPE